MKAKALTLDMGKLMNATTLQVTIAKPIAWRLRTRIGLKLMALGAWIIGVGRLTVETE